MSEWRFLLFEGAKPHACPAALASQLIAEMKERGHAVERDEPLPVYGIDRRGPAVGGRPIEDLAMPGLGRFSVASECLCHYLAELEQCEERRFSDGSRYFKLHSGWSAAVLAPEQRDHLLAQMRARALAAEQRADAFYAEHATPLEIVTAAHAEGAPLVVPEGGEPLARFRRERGRS